MRTISDELWEEGDESSNEYGDGYPGYLEGYRDGAKAEREHAAAALRSRGIHEEDIKAIIGLH